MDEVFPQRDGRKPTARSPINRRFETPFRGNSRYARPTQDRNDRKARVTADQGGAVTQHTSGEPHGESASASADESAIPDVPTQRPTILGAAHAALVAFHRRGWGHDAAALTYYSVLAIVPSIVALVAVIGLVGQDPQTTDAVLELIGRVGPQAATQTFRGTVEGIIRNKDGAGVLLGVGVLGAVWSATGWLDAFFGIANAAHGTTEHRRFIRRKALQIAATLGLGLAVAALTVLVVVTGPVARDAADGLGVGDGALRVWSICKWPVAAGLAVTLLSVLFRIAPDIQGRSWRSSVIGAALGVLTWAAASAGFGIYVASFGSYNATYGALGAIVVFLVWLWITNAALILGTSVDAHLDRPRRSEQ